MGSKEFCVRWNDFESTISTALCDIREDNDFFDVTLACDDKQIQAHKVVLAACSPFFRGILKRNPHPNPLLYLKGVKFTNLLSVLNFMYHGQVNVEQKDLESFLSVAEELKVKGLILGPGDYNHSDHHRHSTSRPTSSTTPPEFAKSVPRRRNI